MKPFIEQANSIYNEYVSSNQTGYKMLSQELKELNLKLISSCTMKGKSHEELHKWLHPHMVLIDELGEANNLEESNKIIGQLTSSFKSYNEYFK